jgi:ABC-type nitrate/sulfonate/bicarbonate transport system permease component
VLILSSTSRIPELYALVLGICAAAFAANTVMVAIERRLTRWRG